MEYIKQKLIELERENPTVIVEILSRLGRSSYQSQVKIPTICMTSEIIIMLAPICRSPQTSSHYIFCGFGFAKEDSKPKALARTTLCSQKSHSKIKVYSVHWSSMTCWSLLIPDTRWWTAPIPFILQEKTPFPYSGGGAGQVPYDTHVWTIKKNFTA